MSKKNNNLKTRKADFPEWIGAEKKLTGIQVDLNLVDTRLSEIRSAQLAESKSDLEREAAQNYLDGKDTPNPVSYDEEINQLHQKRKTLMTAAGIQRQEIDRLHRECSDIICDNRQDEHARLLKKRDGSRETFFEDENAYTGFHLDLFLDGVISSFPVLRFPQMTAENQEQRQDFYDNQKAAAGLGGKVVKSKASFNTPASDSTLKDTGRAPGQLSQSQVEQAHGGN